MHPNKGLSYNLADNLSGKILDELGLDGGGDRPSSNGGGFIRDVRKVGRRVLRLFDFFIKVFDTALYLFNQVFLYF